MRLCVNEIFASIQGEGLHAGTPCVFVRFQGCPVRCPWCDTPHALPLPQANAVGLDDNAFLAGNAHATVTPEALWAHIVRRWPQQRHLVLTGGEPCVQDANALAQLCACVRRSEQEHGQAWRIHVETSGTGNMDWLPNDAWVTLSPKPHNQHMHPGALRRANEIKMVVAGPDDIAWLDSLLASCPGHAPVCLQPRSLDAVATELCVQTVMARAHCGWRLSVQLHKYLGVR